ncbi:MAG TPA: energy transducer TonB [Thermoanaerobaculia bacterium]|nr:energy transducer TonB [Thermoanaerobaculia bacterium]
MEDQIDLIVEDQPEWRGGVSWPVIVSMVVHVVLIAWLIHSYHPLRNSDPAPPIAHYIELIRANPQFTEAPGAKVKTSPLNAPLSDANRKAATPNPTGDTPTTRPGDGSRATFTPRYAAGDNSRSAAAQQAQAPQQAMQQQSSAMTPPPQQPPSSNSSLTYRQPSQQPVAAANGQVDWRNAIREVGKVASLGGGREGLDLGHLGGDKGSAEAGPLSFETTWYDWGEYAESMVSKIRVHWYEEMPMPLLQTGMKGVVTIRFTIHRDGTISDVTILAGSGVAPYDYAAKKAIELASPLKPLPADFPKETEHVTAMFYYNSEPPRR